MGVEVTAKLFIANNFIVISSQKMHLLLIETILPIIIENKRVRITKVKMTTWKTSQLSFQKDTLSLAGAKIDLTLKLKDKEQQLAIYNEIQDWSNSIS